MKVTQVTYSMRVSLGQYQHEELSCTVEASQDEVKTGDEMMNEARKVCVDNTTESRKARAKQAPKPL